MVSVNTWQFDIPYSCAVLTWVVFGWSVLPSCPLMMAKIFWIINEVLWIIIMNSHETWVHCWWWKVFIKAWVFFSSSSSVTVFSFMYSNYYYYSSSEYFLFCSIFLSRGWVSSWVLYIRLIWSYGSSKWTEFTFVQWWEIYPKE